MLTIPNLRLYRFRTDKIGGAALPDHAATRVLYWLEHGATTLRGARGGSKLRNAIRPCPDYAGSYNQR